MSRGLTLLALCLAGVVLTSGEAQTHILLYRWQANTYALGEYKCSEGCTLFLSYLELQCYASSATRPRYSA